MATDALSSLLAQIIVNSLLKGAQNCLSVLLLVFVVYVILGGAATQLWSGVLRNRCYNDSQIVNGVPVYPRTSVLLFSAPSAVPGWHHLPFKSVLHGVQRS